MRLQGRMKSRYDAEPSSTDGLTTHGGICAASPEQGGGDDMKGRSGVQMDVEERPKWHWGVFLMTGGER